MGKDINLLFNISISQIAMKRKIIIAISIVLSGIIFYLFLYGRLFPFSPIIIGFEKYEFEKATVYFHDNEDILDFKVIDSLICKTEQFHQITFKRKVKIFICNSDSETKRLSGFSTRFNTQLSGCIFVSGKANKERKERKIHLNTYLKHELSHSLLFQNMPLISALTYPGWFLEGVAVYSANQMGVDGYFSKEETLNKIEEGFFVEPKDWGTIISSKGKTVKECSIENKYWFIYSEYGLIVESLIQAYGKDKFDTFLEKSLSENDFYSLFERTYNEEFTEYISKFKKQ